MNVKKDKEWTLFLLSSAKDKIEELVNNIDKEDKEWEYLLATHLPFIYSDLNIAWNSDVTTNAKKDRKMLL